MDYKRLPLPVKVLNRALRSVQGHSIVIFLQRDKIRVRRKEDFYAKQALKEQQKTTIIGIYQKGCNPAWIAEDLLAIKPAQWEHWS